MKQEKLAFVVPCYNEQKTLTNNIERFISILKKTISEHNLSQNSFICFVDDGSTDKSWDIIETAHKKYPNFIKGIKFTRNFGNQNAILAGLEYVNSKNIDCVITIDADLQQDENKIGEFIEKYKSGAEIVCGIRNNRKNDNIIKKLSSICFYKTMELLGARLIPNHSEYRLMSKNALNTIYLYQERNLFLRGVCFDTGLKCDYVYFDVKKREFDKSKFSFIALLRLAAWGITSFSVRPLRLIFYVGIFISCMSFVFAFYELYSELKGMQGFEGLRYYEIFEMFLAGIQILAIGIIGEYIGQILQEVKNRPRHIVEKKLD